MAENNAVVAMYKTHDGAEAAVKLLQHAGVDMQTLSIVSKDVHPDEHVVGYYTNGDRMMYWGKAGAFWGGFWGLFFGAAMFAIPGFGPVLVAGPLVASILSGLEGAVVVGGFSALGAGLYGLGIPKNSILEYETAVKADHFLLMVHGTAFDVERARNIISTTQPAGISIHQHDLVGVV